MLYIPTRQKDIYLDLKTSSHTRIRARDIHESIQRGICYLGVMTSHQITNFNRKVNFFSEFSLNMDWELWSGIIVMQLLWDIR